jgi:serine protease Do
MYPYDENNKTPGGENNNEQRCDAPAEDGSYRIVKPDAEQNTCYRDAAYTPQSGASFDGYYVPGGRGGKPTEPEKKPHKRGMGAAGVIALCLVCALLGGVSGGLIANANQPAAVVSETDAPASDTPLVQTSPSAGGTTTSSDGAMSARDIYYDLACKQVVGIQTDITTTNIFGMTVSGSVSGSGFVISEDGYILTNYHVVEDAYTGGYEVKVMFYDGSTYTAEIKGFDRNNDIAVLKIDATGLDAAELGSSDSLYVGDTVYAVGNPLGELSYSMTSGMVSATDRLITTEEGTMTMFQFDAAVNQGNSGGPVYNVYGQVVGVVTAKSNEDGTEGLGFAIPIDDAVRIANDVISGERSLDAETGDAYLGITPADVDSMAAQYYGFPEGAYVRTVTEGSAAEKADIKVGDIITQLDGYDIGSSDELRQELLFHSAGETVDIVVWRSGEYLTLSITFDAKPAENTDSGSQGAYQQPVEPSGGWQDGGFYFG